MAARVLHYLFVLFVEALVPTDMAYRLLRVRIQQARFVPTIIFATLPQAYAAETYLIGVAQSTCNIVDQNQYVKSSSSSLSSSRSRRPRRSRHKPKGLMEHHE